MKAATIAAQYSKGPHFQVGSLFAGMGGFCLAFAKEGFDVAWANEKDNFAALTYAANFPATTLYHKPIQDLSVVGDDLGPVDVLTAGFPCQPFSVAGSKMGFDDDRGKMFFEIIRLIREFGGDRPKILLFENVPHLLTHDRGRSFNRIAHEIQASGYWFMPQQNTAILNTRLHTEIPQNRERLYMVALSWDHFDTPEFNFPAHATTRMDYKELLNLGQKSDRYYYFTEESKYLWWYGYCSYDEGREDSYELTTALLKNLDVAQTLLERAFSLNTAVTRTMLSILLEREKQGKAFYVRERVRDLAKYMVQIGGVTIIDALDETDLRELVSDKIDQLAVA